MSRISLAFFASAVLYALVGTILGLLIVTSQDGTLIPVGRTMNTLGWGSLAAMGAFYGLAGELAPRKLAWINLAVSNVGALISLTVQAMRLRGEAHGWSMLAAGQVLLTAGLVLFALAVLTVARRLPAAT
jgi:hypothetical protein